MPSSLPVIERAKPLLGTMVSVRLAGLAEPCAHKAIDAAFVQIAAVHRAMSFHDAASDISRLNHGAHLAPIEVRAGTYAVIARAIALAKMSEGAFDITIGPQLVRRGHLPRPVGAPEPDPRAGWRDIALLPERRVHFAKPLWIDLGGIAKGYAVDRAMDALFPFAPAQAVINAGGDLRVHGPARERIRLRADAADEQTVPVVELADGALASSESRLGGNHIDSRFATTETECFIAVAAPRCMDADALTKVVLMRRDASDSLLRRCAARAFLHDGDGWREIGGPLA